MTPSGPNMSAASVPQKTADAGEPQRSTCDFCGAAHPLNLANAPTNAGNCPSCGASWRDRTLLEMLIAHEALAGVPSYRALWGALELRKRRIAVVGKQFDRPDTTLPGVVHQFFPEQLFHALGIRRRLPVRADSLDYLLVSTARNFVFSLSSAAEALRAGGVLIVTSGFVWPFPPQGKPLVRASDEEEVTCSLGANPIGEARAAGLTAWFERPGLGTHVLQRTALFIALKTPG